MNQAKSKCSRKEHAADLLWLNVAYTTFLLCLGFLWSLTTLVTQAEVRKLAFVFPKTPIFSVSSTSPINSVSNQTFRKFHKIFTIKLTLRQKNMYIIICVYTHAYIYTHMYIRKTNLKTRGNKNELVALGGSTSNGEEVSIWTAEVVPASDLFSKSI